MGWVGPCGWAGPWRGGGAGPRVDPEGRVPGRPVLWQLGVGFPSAGTLVPGGFWDLWSQVSYLPARGPTQATFTRGRPSAEGRLVQQPGGADGCPLRAGTPRVAPSLAGPGQGLLGDVRASLHE